MTINEPVVSKKVYTECEGFEIVIGQNSYSETGVYKDVINDCDTIITDLTILVAPQFSIVTTEDKCHEGVGAASIVNLIGKSPFLFNWDNGSSDSFINNLQAGSYIATVSDVFGCEKSDTILIRNSECESNVFIPNSFSPNGDGINDLYKVTTKSLSYFKLQIYNRWGEMIFSTEDSNIGWDGTFMGRDCGLGVYTVIIDYKAKSDPTEKLLQQRATIHLIR